MKNGTHKKTTAGTIKDIKVNGGPNCPMKLLKTGHRRSVDTPTAACELSLSKNKQLGNTP